jgi:hypothetical protein
MTRGEPTWTRFDPLDMWCPVCKVAPGCRCVWRRRDGEVFSRYPHAERITDARAATDRARKRATSLPPGWSLPPPPAS